MLVAEAMNKNVKTIRPDATVREAAEIMNKERIGSLVVVAGGGEIAGIVTERDILADIVIAGHDPAQVKIEAIMTKKLVTVDPHVNLEDAADLMVRHSIKKLPVVEKGELIGIITASDMVTYERKLIEKVASLIVTTPTSGVSG